LTTLGSDFAHAVNPRRLGLLLLGLAALSVLPGAVMADSFDLGRQLSVPSIFCAVLFVGAAALSPAFWASDRSPPAWLPVALFALIALYEALELREGTGAGSSIAAAAIVAMAGTWLVLAARPHLVRLPLVVAALTWAFGGLVSDAFADGAGAVRALGELLELAGAGILVVTLVVGLDAAGGPSGPNGAPTLRDLAGRLALAANARTLVLGLAAGSVVFGVLGAIDIAGADWRILDLNQEQTLPALFSSLPLWAAAALALLAQRLGAGPPLLWLGWALVLAFMAFDEVAETHERVQYHFDVGTLVALAPLIVLGGATGLGVLHRIRGHAAARNLLLAGAATWAAAVVLDAVHHPDGSALDYLIVVEELVEVGGSTLIALSMLSLVKGMLRSGAGPSPTIARPPTAVAAGS
jgi:hypothetical protein